MTKCMRLGGWQSPPLPGGGDQRQAEEGNTRPHQQHGGHLQHQPAESFQVRQDEVGADGFAGQSSDRNIAADLPSLLRTLLGSR